MKTKNNAITPYPKYARYATQTTTNHATFYALKHVQLGKKSAPIYSIMDTQA